MNEDEFSEWLWSGYVPESIIYATGLVAGLIGPSVVGFSRPRSKLDLAKKWLKDNGGAHPGCLDRFMQARGMK